MRIEFFNTPEERAGWIDTNCGNCAKFEWIRQADELGEYDAPECELAAGILHDFCTPKAAQRMGFKPSQKGKSWVCAEIEPLPESETLVNETQMRALGPEVAPTLFEVME